MNKSIVIIFNEMSIGGSTTSLLSVLQYMDLKKYRIELLLLKGKGELATQVPADVQILPQVFYEEIRRKNMPRRAMLKVCGKVLEQVKKKPEIARQIMDWENVRISSKTEKEYDIAVAFEEGFPTYYMVEKVKAKKRVAWIHTDYKVAGFWEKIDKPVYEKTDKIILVSSASKKVFDEVFPEYSRKTLIIENMLPINLVRERGDEKISLKMNNKIINLVTVCRIDFSSKGLDRGVAAFDNIKKENKEIRMKWYIIGNGPDSRRLEKMIEKKGLENDIELLGEKKNPLPLVKKMDIFLLPSRFEGKPMAVTEAQILGVPPLVTEYASSHSQISSNWDGLIVENNEQSIEEALKYILKFPEKISFWKENLKKRDFENRDEFQKVMQLFEMV